MTSDEDKDLSAFINEVVVDAAVLVEKNKSVTTQIDLDLKSSNSKVEDKQNDQNLHGLSRRSYESNASVPLATHGESQL